MPVLTPFSRVSRRANVQIGLAALVDLNVIPFRYRKSRDQKRLVTTQENAVSHHFLFNSVKLH